jgi:hypothetical protein
MSYRIACSAIACAAFTAATCAQIDYVSQDRYVHVYANGPTQTITAPDFGEFDENLIFTHEYGTPDGGTATITGVAAQHSILDPWSITVTGDAEGTDGPPAGSSSSSGTTHFEVVFTITDSVPFTLTGHLLTVDDMGGGMGVAYYSLTGPSLNLAYDDPYGLGFNHAFDEAGILEPGEYTFIMHGYGGYGYLLYAFELDFQLEAPPACPWDTAPEGAPDGAVGLGDLNALLSNWGPCPAPCPYDFTPEGGDETVGLGDLNALLSNWGPCP